MSRAASPFAGRLYGVVRVTREWEMARSSFYYQLRIAAQPQRVLRRRGPKTECSDETLTGRSARSWRPRRFMARAIAKCGRGCAFRRDRKSTRLNSSHGYISYAVFCLKKKK